MNAFARLLSVVVLLPCFSLALLDNRDKLTPLIARRGADRPTVGPQRQKFMQERLLSVGESAAHQTVNANTIYKWFDRKELPAHKLGPLWQFLTSEVDQWSKGAHVAEGIAIETPAAASKRKLPRP